MRRLLDCSPIPLGLVDRDGHILFMNRATSEVAAQPAADLIGSDFFGYFIERDAARELFRQVLEDGQGRTATFEVRLGDGTTRTLEFSFGRVDDEHVPGAVFSIARDVSEMLAAERQARTAEHYARSLIEASLDPLVTIDIGGKITDVNEAATRATGFSRGDLIGSDFSTYFTEPDRARAGYERVFSQGSVTDYPLVLRTASGGTVEVLYNASLYYDEQGRVAGVFAAARDVTLLHRSQRALEATNRDMMLLGHMTSLLQSCENLAEAFEVITPTLEQLFPDASGTFYLSGGFGEILELRAAWGDEHARNAVSHIEAADCWALRRGHAHEVGMGRIANPRCRHAADDRGPSICIPLVAHGTALGIVHLHSHGEVDTAQFEHWRSRAATFADSMSLSLANLRLRESLHSMSMRDTLTGLYNRRFMHEALDRELRRMERSGQPLVVAMLDLDHFKAVNDDHGHEAGDTLLREIAGLMDGFRQGSDIACRYGGEEFLLILPEVDPVIAHRRLERFRDAVSELGVRVDDRTVIQVTVSIGIAAFPTAGRTSDELIRAADAALYRAKGAGRNRTEVAPDAIRCPLA